MTSSQTHYPTKAPSPTAITFGVRASTQEFEDISPSIVCVFKCAHGGCGMAYNESGSLGALEVQQTLNVLWIETRNEGPRMHCGQEMRS